VLSCLVFCCFLFYVFYQIWWIKDFQNKAQSWNSSNRHTNKYKQSIVCSRGNQIGIPLHQRRYLRWGIGSLPKKGLFRLKWHILVLKIVKRVNGNNLHYRPPLQILLRDSSPAPRDLRPWSIGGHNYTTYFPPRPKHSQEWRRGAVVAALVTSSKLIYAEPG